MASAETVTKDICWNCRDYVEIEYHESGTNRAFCKKCALELPPSSEELAHLFLSLTVPFKVGDVVEARTAGTILDGTGEVVEVSTDLRHGGTNVFPTFLVKLATKEHELAPDEAWYTEICLRKVEQK